LRRRWFAELLREAASLRCVSSRGRVNLRMVKRRNSPYASHNRAKPKPPRANFSPAMLEPMPLTLSRGQRFAVMSEQHSL